MPTFTATFTGQHSHSVQFAGIVAYNKHTAPWPVTSNQTCQTQIALQLNAAGTLTATVA